MPAEYTPEVIAEYFTQINKRLRMIEEQLGKLSNEVGIQYVRPLAEIPDEVAQLAEEGKRLEAMKKYRELTNATAAEAREVMAQL